MKLIVNILLGVLIMASYSCHYHHDKMKNKKAFVAKTMSPEKKEDTNTQAFEPNASELNEKFITEILTTSTRFKEVTKGLTDKVKKNGGLRFELRLERSPYNSTGKNRNYSKSYDFTLYEVYSDRTLNTNRFSYDPNLNQLFEYNAAEDKLEPIAFDRVYFQMCCISFLNLRIWR